MSRYVFQEDIQKVFSVNVIIYMKEKQNNYLSISISSLSVPFAKKF